MCEACKKANALWKRAISCEGCQGKRPEIERGNIGAVWVIEQLGGTLTDSWGGINTQNIESGLRLLKIPQKHKKSLLPKIITFLNELRKEEEKENAGW